MNKIKTLFLLLIASISYNNTQAQLLDCAGVDSNKVFIHDGGNNILRYDPTLPLSPTNPSLFVASPQGMGGLAIAYNINGGIASPTFYSNIGGTYQYWNGAAWVNTGHAVPTVNPGGGVNFIYSIDGGSGAINKYDGTGPAFALNNVPPSSGPYDLHVDNLDNFYHMQASTQPGLIRKFNSVGVLIDTFILNGNPIQNAGGGFEMIGNEVFAVYNSIPSFYRGTIIAGICNLTPVGNMPASDLATCPSTPANANVAFSMSKSTICAGECITFTDLSLNPLSWNWTFPTGNPPTSNSQNPGTICFNTPGNYDIKLVVTNANGIDSISQTLIVLPVPVATITGDSVICDGASTTLTADPAGATYLWNNADINQSVTVTPPLGITSYSVIVTQNICSDTAYRNVTVLPVPVASITGDTEICEGESTTLTASPAGLQYSWDNGSNSQYINVTPNVTTTYTVTVTQAICSDTESVTVVVWPFASGTISKDTLVCNGEPVQLFVTGGIGQYQWYPAATLSCEFCPDPIATALGTTTYYAVLLEPHGCQDTLAVRIENHPPFQLILHNSDTTIYQGDYVELKASGAPFYFWSPTDYLTYSQSNNPIATPYEDITYTVTGVSLLQGCPQKESVHIKVIQKDVILPNAFSPNGDGKNDVFRVIGNKFVTVQEFIIFNRWGTEMFRTNDIKKGWDGTYKGIAQDPDVYFYSIRVSYPNGKVQFLKGDVTLVR